MRAKGVKASETSSASIIGVFEGECADSNITNKNGLDITSEVWINVFDSEEYKTGIELGHFIGFLGHPSDPADQNFMNACIVMTEGHIADNGKVYGKFNLIDTPVGRIVKTFIDAGVKFGISVRGAGDIIDNSVDPETFVFRGFDLVAFPAYPESIPEFTAIAASTDMDKRKKYQAVCAAVKENLDSINSTETLDIIQSQFAKQSDEYKMIEDKKAAIEIDDDLEDINAEKIEAMTNLYLQASEQLETEKRKNKVLSKQIQAIEASNKRRIQGLNRIYSAQMSDVEEELSKTVLAYSAIKTSNKKVKEENIRLNDKAEVYASTRAQLAEMRKKYITLKADNQKAIRANTELQSQLKDLEATNKKLSSSNLIYKQRIEATANDIQAKDSVISQLRSELSETVTAAQEVEARTSNRDAMIQKLKQEVKAATALVQEYQDAYASLYANAVGVRLEDVSVTSSTSVKDLQKIISGSVTQPQFAITADEQLDIVDDYDGDDIVTV